MSVLTLGFQVLAAMRDLLVIPDGDSAGKPFVATDEQAQFILDFYRVDGDGRRTVRRGQLIWPKGMGKSPIAAAIAAMEAKGPTQFGGWARDGSPIGVPHPSPWIQIAGVSIDAAVNTWAALLEMIAPENRSPFCHRFPDVDIGLTRIYMAGSGRIEPVTASAGTRRGQRTTFAVLDESSLWTKSNGGIRLAETIRDNVAKMGGSSIETTNQFVPGQDSVAERTFKARSAAGVLCDVRTSSVDVKSLRHVRKLHRRLSDLYGQSSWIDLDRLVEEAQDSDVDETHWRRMFSNEVLAASDAWVTPKEWAACESAGEAIPEDTLVAAGFDGSRFDDSTALIVVGLEDPLVEIAGLWEKPAGAEAWEVPYDLVDEAVELLHERYQVSRLYCDPPHWQDKIDAWAATYPSVMVWETYRPRPMAAAVDRTEIAIRSEELRHPGDPSLTRHVLNTRYDLNRFGKRLRKDFPKSPDKIDASVAMVLAIEARADAITAGALTRKKHRVAGF